MIYPTWQIYEKLYAKYLHQSPRKLLDAAGDLKDKSVLDLCGGTGKLSLAAHAVDRGRRIVMVESDLFMVPDSLKELVKIIKNLNLPGQQGLQAPALEDRKFHPLPKRNLLDLTFVS